jgi:hypothetical protein
MGITPKMYDMPVVHKEEDEHAHLLNFQYICFLLKTRLCEAPGNASSFPDFSMKYRKKSIFPVSS